MVLETRTWLSLGGSYWKGYEGRFYSGANVLFWPECLLHSVFVGVHCAYVVRETASSLGPLLISTRILSDQGPILLTSCNLHDVVKGPRLQIQPHWGPRLQHMKLAESGSHRHSAHNRSCKHFVSIFSWSHRKCSRHSRARNGAGANRKWSWTLEIPGSWGCLSLHVLPQCKCSILFSLHWILGLLLVGYPWP